MKYTIFGFSQKFLVKHKLDLTDAVILRYFLDFKSSGKIGSEKINGVNFYWLKYQYITEEFPIMKIKKDTIYRHMQKMVDRGILLQHTRINEEGIHNYYSPGDELKKQENKLSTSNMNGGVN